MSFAAHPRADTPAPPPVAPTRAGDAERARADLVPFSVAVQRHGNVAIVEPRGELDVATAQTLHAILEEIKTPGRLVLDLRGLSFIDSSGLHLLVALHQRAQRDGFQLALIAPTPPVDRAIHVSGLGKTLPFVPPSAIE
jgi:anti-sigma B factor antagonist